MVRWVSGLAVVSLLTFNLLSAEELANKEQANVEEKKETASSEKKDISGVGQSESRHEVKRRWVKKSRPNVPRARKALPGRKKAVSPIGEIVVLDEEEESEEMDLPVREGNPG